MKNITELYCITDDLVKEIEKKIKNNNRGRKNKLNKSELVTIALIGHFDGIETDKKLYEYITTFYKYEFRNVPCYEQFTRGIKSISKYLDLIIDVFSQMNISDDDDFYIIDASSLPVSKFDPYNCPKWASDEAKLGKNIFGYYFGFKLHLIISRSMKIVSCMITPANIHDVKALTVKPFLENINGLLIGDKGYVCPTDFLKELKKSGIELIFKQRKNMDPYLNIIYEYYLKQRQVIEGVFSYLKNRLKAVHKFARSCESFLVHVKASILAFMFKDKVLS